MYTLGFLPDFFTYFSPFHAQNNHITRCALRKKYSTKHKFFFVYFSTLSTIPLLSLYS